MPVIHIQNRLSNTSIGITFIVIAMLSISINDMLIKQLSGGYPLHQLVFVRSLIGVAFSLMLVQFEGGWSILRTRTPALHALRCILIVLSNLTYFTALAAMPLADATALFFVAPLFITLLSIPMLGEKVGPWRIAAAAVGFLGVLIMLQPWAQSTDRSAPLFILALPLVAAVTYALNQILTRQLGATSKASALAVYIQATFILVSFGFFLIAGDGRFAQNTDNPSLVFLLRAWTWPDQNDWYLFLGLGVNSGILGYAISQAYRSADVATVAPFEYVALPMAIFWGWIIWGEIPEPSVAIGIVLIVGGGLLVYLRERHRKQRIVSGKRVHRRY